MENYFSNDYKIVQHTRISRMGKMNIKKEIYNKFLQQLSENDRIPKEVLRDVKKLFDKNTITSAQLKSSIEKAINNDNKN